MIRTLAGIVGGSALLALSALPTLAAELVMFERPDCPWCRQFDREIAPGYTRSEEGKRAPLRRLDISKQTQAGFALKSPVTLTPTFVLSDGGREIGRVSGYPGTEFFYPMIHELLDRLPK